MATKLGTHTGFELPEVASRQLFPVIFGEQAVGMDGRDRG